MDIIQRTEAIFRTAERELAEVASEAAKDGSYDAAGSLIEMARTLSQLAASTKQRLDGGVPKVAPPDVDQGSLTRGQAGRTGVPRARARKGDYPKFLREGQSLVKIGWSRSEKTEYEHKSPQKVLPILAAAVTRAGARGKRFSMDRVLPLVDGDETKIPDYQAYLCLGWFKELGFLVQHGRQGYSLASGAPIEPLIEAHWANLPSR